MKNESTSKWGQIEFNTIASSFGALSDLVHQCHRFLMTRYLGIEDAHLMQPKMNVTEHIASAMATAAKLVHQQQPIVLFVVQNGEKNSADQRRIEYALWNGHKVKVLRRTLGQVYESGTLLSEVHMSCHVAMVRC